jgi:hypothetical protein
MLREVIVEIESSIESRSKRLAVENHRANKCRSVIVLCLEQFCHSWMCGRQGDGEIRYAVRAGEQPSEDAGVGCVGNRARRKSLGETQTVFR